MDFLLQSTPAHRTSANMGSPGKLNGRQKGGKKQSIEVPEVVPRKPKLSEKTDYRRWRMLDEKGRQTWHYLEDDKEMEFWPQTKADKYYLGIPLVR